MAERAGERPKKNVLFRGGEGGRYKVTIERTEYRNAEVELSVGATWTDYMAAVEEATGVKLGPGGDGWVLLESRPL